MALRWIEGWETHTGTAQLDRKYATRTGSITVQSGRVFGNSAGIASLVAVTPSWADADVITFGFGCRLSSQQAALNSGAQGLYVERAGAEQMHVEMESNAGSFEWRVMRGATELFKTSSAFAYGIWHYFEFQITVHTSTGTYEVRHNEAAVGSGTGVNTAASGSNQADTFAIRYTSNVSTSLFYDDMYVLDGTGGVNDDFLGDSVVEGLLPNADGATIQWTPGTGSNWQNVDDGASTPADGTNTNSSGTIGQKDLYDFAALSGITGTIHGVQAAMQLALDAAGSRDVDARFRDPGGSEAVYDTYTVASTSFQGFQSLLDQNPVTASPWAAADINGGQFGPEVAT